MSELDVRKGDVWRRKRNGRLVTVTNPQARVVSSGADIEYVMENGKTGSTWSGYWHSTFEIESRPTVYTPTTEAVRNAYIRSMREAFVTSEGEAGLEFDRWLASTSGNVGAP